MKNLKPYGLLSAMLFCWLSAAAQNQLWIPPVLNGPVYNLQMQNGTHSFYPGHTTPTMGFNGNILGPTLILQGGTRAKMNVLNSLGEDATVHWHGLHVSPENDGGPHSVIGPNETYSPTFTVLNNAATYWYHPHLHQNTTRQVLNGLAGMIIVKDAAEAALSLPRTYGVDDFPLIVQTKSIDPVSDTIRYGFNGNPVLNKDSILMVNATVNPVLDVPRQMVRFRLLNASAQRVFRFGFAANNNFYQIASDDGLLNAPVTVNRVMLAPGERAELLVDFSGYAVGSTVFFDSYANELRPGVFGATIGVRPPAGSLNYNPNALNGSIFSVIQFHVVAATTSPVPLTAATISQTLNSLTPIAAATATVTRNKYFTSSSGGTKIGPNANSSLNNLYADNVNNDTVNLNTTEIWVLHGDSAQYHPFHIHDVAFYILDRKDSTQAAVAPSATEAGLKDVVMIKPKETVRIIMKFEDFTSDVPYVYHCHISPHEDKGMMANFLVYDNIYVDKNYFGTHTGSFAQPYQKFIDAVTAAKDGSTIVFKSGGDHAYTYPPYITVQNKRIRIKLTAGLITID